MGWITQRTVRADDAREIALEIKAHSKKYRIRVGDLQLATFTGGRAYADAVFEGASTMLEGWLETIDEKNRRIDGLRKSRDANARAKRLYVERAADFAEQLEAVKARANDAERALEHLRDYHDEAVERTHEFAGQLHAARRRASKAEEAAARHRAEAERYRHTLETLVDDVENIASRGQLVDANANEVTRAKDVLDAACSSLMRRAAEFKASVSEADFRRQYEAKLEGGDK